MTKKKMARLVGEAERLEQEHEEGAARSYVRPLPPKQPSQVYSIRIPVNRLEALRQLARERGQAPSVLLRDWILERLSEEMSPASVIRRFSKAGIIVIGAADIFDPESGLEGLPPISFVRDFRSVETELALTAGAGLESS